MRGQIEASFQWIFVVVAGGAFLIFFFLTAKGCSESGELRAEGLELQSIQNKFETAAWQPDSTSNFTVSNVEVTCPAGVITLKTDKQLASLDKIPLFTPGYLTRNVQLITREILVTEENSPAISLGHVLYALDDNTYYFSIRDSQGGFNFPFEHENVKYVQLEEIQNPEALLEYVPNSAKAIVVVSTTEGYVANLDASSLPGNIYGVFVDESDVIFYEWKERMEKIATLGAEHELITAGAVVSGEPGLYKCGRISLTERMRHITTIYENRAEELQYSLFFTCAYSYETVHFMLENINNQTRTDDYLDKLFTSTYDISQAQIALLTQSCPVIA